MHLGHASPAGTTRRREQAITRTALVGGGSSGIGRAAALCLARAGHRVVLVGRRPEPLARAAASIAGETGAEVGTVVHDLADSASAAGLLKHVEETFAPLDVLVLNAGGPPPGRIADVTDEAWRSSFELLVLGPLRLATLVLPGMAGRGFGRIVVVTSTAVRQPQPGLAASVVLRAAATSAAKLLSLESADRGVTVNCVAPGATDTPRRLEILASRAAASGATPEEAAAADTADIPAGRAGRPDELGAAIAFLCSEAAGYVNGAVLTVDGGRTETI